MDSDPFETGVSSESTNRRMSSNITGHLRDKPNGNNQNAKVVKPA